MLQVLTAKLKLEVTPEQKEQLRVTSLAYRDALNYTSRITFEKLNKTYNGTKIQKEVYYTLREKFKLGLQMACNVPRQVGDWLHYLDGRDGLSLIQTTALPIKWYHLAL